jgi:hypothetical protein
MTNVVRLEQLVTLAARKYQIVKLNQNKMTQKREMTWEEQVHWVMKNTDVELENLYIVEEIAKESTPTHIVTTQVGEEIIVTYERL